MSEINVQVTADPELGITKTTDLAKQEDQIKNQRNRVAKLQHDIEQRIANSELNLQQLKKRRDENIQQLKNKYHSCLNKGDKIGADRCLDDIRKAYTELKRIAAMILKSEEDVSDLEQRSNELNREACLLVGITLKNLEIAKQQDIFARQLTGNAIGMDLFKLRRVIEDGKNLAQKILAE